MVSRSGAGQWSITLFIDHCRAFVKQTYKHLKSSFLRNGRPLVTTSSVSLLPAPNPNGPPYGSTNPGAKPLAPSPIGGVGFGKLEDLPKDTGFKETATFVFPGGSSYSGGWKHGQPHGDGTFTTADGNEIFQVGVVKVPPGDVFLHTHGSTMLRNEVFQIILYEQYVRSTMVSDNTVPCGVQFLKKIPRVIFSVASVSDLGC